MPEFKERVEDGVIVALFEQGMSDEEIARTTDEPVTYIARRRSALGLKRRKVASIPRAELEAMVGEGLNDQQIAERTGKTVQHVKMRRYAFGLVCGSPRERPLTAPIDEDKLRRMLEAGASYRACAKEFRVEVRTIMARAKRLGIKSHFTK